MRRGPRPSVAQCIAVRNAARAAVWRGNMPPLWWMLGAGVHDEAIAWTNYASTGRSEQLRACSTCASQFPVRIGNTQLRLLQCGACFRAGLREQAAPTEEVVAGPQDMGIALAHIQDGVPVANPTRTPPLPGARRRWTRCSRSARRRWHQKCSIWHINVTKTFSFLVSQKYSSACFIVLYIIRYSEFCTCVDFARMQITV
jgi:hypothetical protein